MQIILFTLIWLKILLATHVQTVTKPDRIYFDHFCFFWLLFQKFIPDCLEEIGNFIKNKCIRHIGFLIFNCLASYRVVAIETWLWCLQATIHYVTYFTATGSCIRQTCERIHTSNGICNMYAQLFLSQGGFSDPLTQRFSGWERAFCASTNNKTFWSTGGKL